MTIPENGSGCNHPDCPLPAELTGLTRWACWRSRTKKSQDRHKGGVRTAERVVYEALHPATGRELASSRPDEWVEYTSATNPLARKPFGGLAFLVRQDDGLGVLRHAEHDVLGRLGANLVHAEQEVDGDGLVVIVRAGVYGAKTDVFVPLSGRTAYHGTRLSSCPDGEECVSGRKPDGAELSGRNPCQRRSAVRTEPVPAKVGCPDGTRTVFSSSLKSNYQDGDPDPVRTEVEAYARMIVEQGKASDPSKWVYGLIGVFKRHHLTVKSIPANLLLMFEEAIGEDEGTVQRRVLAGWSRWKAHKVPLADALLAVRADPSLLKDLPPVLVDGATLMAAAMCKYMGVDGKPFALPGRVLAAVLGLRGQQEGSEVIGALVELKLIRQTSAGSYANKRAAEYVLVAAENKSVPAARPVEVVRPVEGLQPVVCSPPVAPVSDRPGHSHERTPEYDLPSKLGGFVTCEHYLAEWVLARRLASQERELFDGFWNRPDIGAEYGRQVATARSLLRDYSFAAVCRALRSKDGRWCYSLAAPPLVEVIRAEQARLDRQHARREGPQEAGALAPPLTPPASGPPRPHFSSGKSLLRSLSGL